MCEVWMVGDMGIASGCCVEDDGIRSRSADLVSIPSVMPRFLVNPLGNVLADGEGEGDAS